MTRPRVAEIQAAVCAHYGLTANDMVSTCRLRSVTRPRQVAMYLARRLTVRSLPEIGRAFGGRDHTTVSYGVASIHDRLADDPELADAVAAIEAALRHRCSKDEPQ